MHAFTLKNDTGLLRVLKTPADVRAGLASVPAGTIPPLHRFNAIWDTGATASVITDKVVAACGLKPIGMVEVHGVHGKAVCAQHFVDIGLPNGVMVTDVIVTVGGLPDGDDVLIGMDVISLGDFTITNKENKTIFTFCVPSSRAVDYVVEIQQAQQAAVDRAAATMRNAGNFSRPGKKRRR